MAAIRRGALRRCVALVCCALHALLLHGVVRAEPVDPARSASARALFEEGVAHTDRDEWQPAADAFRRALALRDSQVIRFNLASALVELGKLVEASELLHAVQADAQVDGALREQALDKLADLKPRIARLTVQVEAALPTLEVELDEGSLALSQLDVPLMVDPGEHVLLERLDGALVDEQHVTLSEGGTLLVTLRAPAPKVVPVAAPVPAPAETARLALEPAPAAPLPARDDASVQPSRKKLWWGLAVGGAGLVAFATLVAIFVPHHKGSSTVQGDFDPPSVGVRVPQ